MAMTKLNSDQVFQANSRRQLISLVVTGTGTSILEKLAGNDETGTWVAVTDGTITNAGEITFWAPYGQKFRVDLSGTEAWVTI